MEIYTPESVLSLMSTLIPALARPPFSQTTLDKVLIFSSGLADEFYAAGISVHWVGEGGWPSGEEQPICSQPVAGKLPQMLSTKSGFESHLARSLPCKEDAYV